MQNSTKSVAIVGAGIAGIATAIRLANKGFKVTVYEANLYPGGKLSEFWHQGYRFDAGPSLFTLPHLVDELFTLSGKNSSDYFKYQKLDVTCKYFYEDGTVLSGYSNPQKFEQEVFLKTGESEIAIREALENSRNLYDLLSDLFMNRSLHHWKTYFNSKAFKAYRNLHKMDFLRTMNASNESRFKDKRIVQLFNRYATYNGSDPFQTPATLNIIPHLEFNIGAFYPVKGMYSITESLFALAKDLGVTFELDTRVEKILVDNKLAKGLQVEGKEIFFSKIVSNMDMVNTYKKLLPQSLHPKKLLDQPKSSSALIFYWGMNRTFEELDVHNIFFSEDYKKEFDYIFNQQSVSEDPTVYINITSKYKPDDAPGGCENWFTMINVPNNSGQDWDQLISLARENIMIKLSRLLKVDVKSFITCEQILDPRLLEAKTSSFSGALYGNSSNNKFAAFLRHPNFHPKIKNLFFCGGSVHPGGGIPLCLLSAKIVSEFIED